MATRYADSSFLGAFRKKARDWALKVVKLYNTPVPPELKAEKSTLLKSAQYIKKGVESIFGTIEELENVGLGIPLLIPLAVVGASAAAIYAWNRSFAKFEKKMAYHKTLVNKGYSPEQASKAVKSFEGEPWIKLDAKTILPIAVLGGGLWWLYTRRPR